MNDFTITWETSDATRFLKAASGVRYEAVVKKSVAEIYNRGKAPGGTPVSTEATRPGGPHGELKQSLRKEVHKNNGVVGYVKEYAPYVEFGHRTRGGGGYVPGQHYLKKNVDTQQPIFEKDCRDQLIKLAKGK